MADPRFTLLFVCTGNICRSPTAHGMMRRRLQDAGLDLHAVADSAGTHGYHVGDPPDPRTVSAALGRGLDLSDLRARRVGAADFRKPGLILAMDRGHQRLLRGLMPPGSAAELRLFLEFAPGLGHDVPDPYYGGPDGFDEVLDLVEAGTDGLIAHLRRNL